MTTETVVRERAKKEAQIVVKKIVVKDKIPFERIYEEIQTNQKEYPLLSCYSKLGLQSVISAAVIKAGFYTQKDPETLRSIIYLEEPQNIPTTGTLEQLTPQMEKVYVTLISMKKAGVKTFTAREANKKSGTSSFENFYRNHLNLVPLKKEKSLVGYGGFIYSFIEDKPICPPQTKTFPLETKERAPCLPDTQDLIQRAIDRNGAANISALNGIRGGYDNLATKMDENNKLLTQIRDVGESKLYQVLNNKIFDILVAIEKQQNEIFLMWKRIEDNGIEKRKLETKLLDLQTEMLQEEKTKSEEYKQQTSTTDLINKYKREV